MSNLSKAIGRTLYQLAYSVAIVAVIVLGFGSIVYACGTALEMFGFMGMLSAIMGCYTIYICVMMTIWNLRDVKNELDTETITYKGLDSTSHKFRRSDDSYLD